MDTPDVRPLYLRQWYEGATEDELRGYLYATHGLLVSAYEELSFLERCLEYEAFLENREFAAMVA